MKKFTFAAILSYILLVGLLSGLMIFATGCKKNPTANPTGAQSTTLGTSGGSQTENSPQKEETQQQQTEDPLQTESPAQTEASQSTESLSGCNHVPGNWIVDKSSTCTTEGSRHRICSVCYETIEEEEIPVINHTPGSWILDRSPTCAKEGMRHQSCTQCKTVLLYIATAKTAHDEYAISGYDATATKTGLTDGKKCRRCGEVTQPQYVIPLSGAGGFGYHVNEDNTTCSVIALDDCSNATVSVPSAVAGYKVTGIGNSAFENCAAVSQIILPSSVTSIGQRAFAGCTGLTTVVYQGTTAQWSAIEKGMDWNKDAGNFTLNCTNG